LETGNSQVFGKISSTFFLPTRTKSFHIHSVVSVFKMSSASNLKAKFEQKAAVQNQVDYVVGKEKKTWKTTGNSGGGHSGHDGKFQSAIVKEKTQFA
jgi:hypothetical protein